MITRNATLLAALAAGLLLSACKIGSAPAAGKSAPAGAAETRKSRILDSLKFKFPQLATLNPEMGDIKPSTSSGLDEGSFTINGQQGPQTQKFFVTKDDKALFLSDPIDVSRSVAEQKADKKAEMAKLIAGLPTRGNPDATVTIIEYSDFQCPFCKKGYESIEAVMKTHGDRVKLVFKHFPLEFHPWARPAAVAAHCAAQQDPDAFWKLHDQYFNNQEKITVDNVMAQSRGFLKASKVDLAKWAVCAEKSDAPEYRAADMAITDSMESGKKLGVTGTPAFFVNGRFLNGAVPPEQIIAAIEDAQKD